MEQPPEGNEILVPGAQVRVVAQQPQLEVVNHLTDSQSVVHNAIPADDGGAEPMFKSLFKRNTALLLAAWAATLTSLAYFQSDSSHPGYETFMWSVASGVAYSFCTWLISYLVYEHSPVNPVDLNRGVKMFIASGYGSAIVALAAPFLKQYMPEGLGDLLAFIFAAVVFVLVVLTPETFVG